MKKEILIEKMSKQLDVMIYRDCIIPILNNSSIMFYFKSYAISEIPLLRFELKSDLSNDKLRKLIELNGFLSTRILDNDGQIMLNGHYKSFSALNGRASAHELPMMSLPKIIKDYLYIKDNVLIEFDMTNAEISALAWLSGDEVLRRDIEFGVYDTLKMIIDSELKTDVPRKIVKTMIIQLIYGASHKTVIESAIKMEKLTNDVVTHAINLIENRYQQAWQYLDAVAKDPYINFAGKRTQFLSSDVESGWRTTVNIAVASVISTLMKLWAVELVNEGINVVNTVHDSVWLSVDPNMDLIALKMVVEMALNKVRGSIEVHIKTSILGEKIGAKI